MADDYGEYLKRHARDREEAQIKFDVLKKHHERLKKIQEEFNNAVLDCSIELNELAEIKNSQPID